MMEDSGVIWAQNIVDRWAAEKAIPSPRVRMISRIKQGMLARYRDNIIFLYQKSWHEDDLHGKILLLAHEFGHHIQKALGLEFDDDNASALGREFVDLELQVLAEARGVTVSALVKEIEGNSRWTE